jgi:hypothetical protein
MQYDSRFPDPDDGGIAGVRSRVPVCVPVIDQEIFMTSFPMTAVFGAALLYLASLLPETLRAKTFAGSSDIRYIELRIDACRAEETCRRFSLLFDPYHVSLMTCMIAGQREIAAWQAGHPSWRVTRWSCGFAIPGESSA